MENVVVSIFWYWKWNLSIFQIKTVESTEIQINQASIVKAENGVINVKDSFDLMIPWNQLFY